MEINEHTLKRFIELTIKKYDEEDKNKEIGLGRLVAENTTNGARLMARGIYRLHEWELPECLEK